LSAAPSQAAVTSQLRIPSLPPSTLKRVAGTDNVRLGPPVGVAEDFSFFQQKVPGQFVFLGVTPRDQDHTTVPQNYSPLFFR
jgi:amidohydrolase